MERDQEILRLSEEILTDFELNRLPTEQIILKCKRLARFQDDFEALKWFELELNGYDLNTLPEGFTKSDADKHSRKSGRYYQKEVPDLAAIKEGIPRAIGQATKLEWFYDTGSIGEIETTLESLRVALVNLKAPETYTPAITRHESGSAGIFAGMVNEHVHEKYSDVLNQVRTQQSRLSSRINDYRSLLSKIRSHIASYVLSVNYKYKFGGLIASIFDECRKETDDVLALKCPGALKEIVAAYERLSSDKPEVLAQALTSCRRFLKEFADVVFPASQEPYTDASGRSHDVAEKSYINRIRAHIDKCVRGENRKALFELRLEDLGKRIEAIYDFASQGVHDRVTKNDVDMCVIDSYLLIGALLKAAPLT